jgi:hypothetical protein
MARHFDGAADSYEWPSGSIQDADTNGITILFWALIDVYGENDMFTVINDQTTWGLRMGLASSNRFYLWGNCSGTDFVRYSSNNMQDVGNWHHFGTAWTGTGITAITSNVDMYRDGVVQNASGANQNGTGVFNSNDDTFTIGSNWSGSSLWFDGKMAEYCIFGRKLATAEITAIYNGVSPLFFPGLQAYVPFRGGPNCWLNGAPATVNGGAADFAHPAGVRWTDLNGAPAIAVEGAGAPAGSAGRMMLLGAG